MEKYVSPFFTVLELILLINRKKLRKDGDRYWE
jgi:hypothetical protein